MSSTQPHVDAWHAAQLAEREFHCSDDGYMAVRRKFEHQKRLQYAALMMLDNHAVAGKRVLDLGCGPQSLLLQYESRADACVALDPLQFTDEDERRYLEASIERIVMPAEHYETATLFDEVWIYNCLQHVIDPEAVCATAQGSTKGAVRIFEYLNVPTDAMHLHVLKEEAIDAYFNGMNCYSKIVGSMRVGGAGSVSFYAACFLHRSINPEHWL